MPWLLTLLETVGLNWLWGKLTAFLTTMIARYKSEKEIEDLVKADIDKLKAANDAKSKEDAANDLAGHI